MIDTLIGFAMTALMYSTILYWRRRKRKNKVRMVCMNSECSYPCEKRDPSCPCCVLTEKHGGFEL